MGNGRLLVTLGAVVSDIAVQHVRGVGPICDGALPLDVLDPV